MGRPKKSCNKQGHKAGGARQGCGRKSATYYRERHEEHLLKIKELETQVADLLKQQEQYEKEHPSSTTQQQTEVTEPAEGDGDYSDSDDETSSDDDDEQQQQQEENNPLHLMKAFRLSGSKSYMPPVGSPIGDYLTNIKKQMIQKTPQEIKSMSMWIPPPSASSDHNDNTDSSTNNHLLEHVWIYVWLLKEQFDITTNPCIHCASLQTQSEGLAFRPMIWWDNIVWVLHRRYRCNNKKCHYTGTRGTRCSFSTMDYQYLKQLPFEISNKFEFISKPSGMGIHKSMLQVLSNFDAKETYSGNIFAKVIQQCNHERLEEKVAAYQVVRKPKKSKKRRRQEEEVEESTTLAAAATTEKASIINVRESLSSQQQQETQQQQSNNKNEREVLEEERRRPKQQQTTRTSLPALQDLSETNANDVSTTVTTTNHDNQNISRTATAIKAAANNVQPPASTTTTTKRQTRSSSKRSRTAEAAAVAESYHEDESPAPDMNTNKTTVVGRPPPPSEQTTVAPNPAPMPAPAPARPPPPPQHSVGQTTTPFTTTTIHPPPKIRYTYSYRKQPKYQRRNKPRKCANYPLCDMDASECGGYISASCRNPSIIGTGNSADGVTNNPDSSPYICHDVRHPQLPTKDEVLAAREQQKQITLKPRRCAWYPICVSYTNECGGHTRDKCGLYGTDGIHPPPSIEEFDKARKRDLAHRRAESRRKQKEKEEQLQQRWKKTSTTL